MSGRCARVWIVTWIGSLLLCAAPLAAQIGGGSLTGSVADQSGTAVPGATVHVTAIATNLSRSTVADETGRYTLPSLSPGLYRIHVEAPGFRPLIRDSIRLA